jgi:uncharacterized protein YegP (UPF0339 family)
MTKFTIYKTRSGQWRWRLRGKNGEILASGESYKRRKDCFAVISLVKKTNAKTPVDFPNKA